MDCIRKIVLYEIIVLYQKKNVIFTFKSKLMHIILVYTTTVRTYFLFYHNINLYDSERNLRIWVGSASFGLK